MVVGQSDFPGCGLFRASGNAVGRCRGIGGYGAGRRPLDIALAVATGDLTGVGNHRIGALNMDVELPRSSHPRAQAARYQAWFHGRGYYAWYTLAGILIALLAAASWLAWPLGIRLLIGGILIGAVQPLLWWKLYLRDLPPDTNAGTDAINANRLAEAGLLRYSQRVSTPRGLWDALLEEWSVRFVFNRLLLDPQQFSEYIPNDPQLMPQLWQRAYEKSRSVGSRGISSSAMAVALLQYVPDIEAWLQQYKLRLQDVEEALDWQQRTTDILRRLDEKRIFGGVARDWAAGYTPLLNRFGHDMSRDVEHGAYQHLYLQTHSDSLDQIEARLSQPTQNAVALVGKTGSGRTSLAYALAERLLTGEVRDLARYKVFAMDAAAIVAEANRSGNLEAIMMRLAAEAGRSGNIVLFFDDAHNFFSHEAGASDMTNILLQLLQSGAVRAVFALNPNDWQYLASNAPDLTARLQPVQIREPDQVTTEKVLQDQCLAIEAETGIHISYLAVREAYKLAERYVQEQAFPGKGVSLLKSATTHADYNWVTPESVQRTVESMTGAKVTSADSQERDVLLNLEDNLHQRMVNQTFAVGVVADALRRARAGVSGKSRPAGSFLFLGPTGVGKTELSKALATTYFGGVEHIVRVDMSEYNQAESVQRLLAPAGNPGTFLTQVRTQPFSVVLLDEVEKASDEVLNLLLQMLDEGQLTDTQGLQVSFRDAVIITTSNAGADIIRSRIESGENLEDFSREFTDQLIDDNHFKPELINRFDEVVLFRPLDKSELLQVLELLLEEVNRNLAAQQVAVNVTQDAAETLVEQGYDPRLGARPMRRVVQRTVENVVSKRLLSSALKPGDTLTLDVADITGDNPESR